MKKSEITKTCVEYCQKLLTNREPKEEFRQDLEMKRKIHNVRMKERSKDEPDLAPEMYNDVLKN